MGFVQNILMKRLQPAIDEIADKKFNDMVEKQFDSVDFFNSYFKGMNIYPEGNPELNQNIYEVVSTVYRSVSVIAENIAQLKLKVYDTTDESEPKDITDNPEFALFSSYNDEQTDYDFWESVISYLELTGEAPMIKRIEGNTITGLYPFSNDHLIVVPKNDFAVEKYFINVSGNMIPASIDDIMLLKYFNPSDPLRGLSPLQAALRDVRLDIQATKSTTNMFKKGARPSGIVSTVKDLNPTTYDRAVKAIRSSTEGEKNHGKLAVMSNGFRYQQMSLSPKDMALIEQRNFTKTSVREVYGVPPMFLMDFSDSSVLQNTDAQEKLFWRSTVIPRLTKIEKLFTTFLIPDMTDKKNICVKFDLSKIGALKEDIESKHNMWLDDVKEGVVTREEMRREFYPNLEESNAPGMDDHIIPGYYEATEEEPDAMDTIDEALNEIFPDSELDDVAKSVKETNENYKSEMEEEEIARIVREVLKQSDEIAEDFEGSWKELYRKQGKEVVANIDKLKMYKQDPAEFSGIFDIDKWIKEFEEEGKTYIFRATREGMDQWINEFGGSGISLNPPGLEDYVNEQSRSYATITNETTQKEIDKIIAKGLADGKSITEISNLIGGYFEASEKYRATRISQTEMVRSYNKGRLEANKQSSTYPNHFWATSRDALVRESHADAEGQTVKAGDSFNVDDSTQSDSAFPSGINERCTTIPTNNPVNV